MGFLAQSRLTDCRGPDRAVPSRAVGSCWRRGGATASRGFGPPDVSREGAGTWTCTRGLQGTPRAARHCSPGAVRSSPSPAHPPCPELAAHASSLPPTSSPNSGRWKRKRVQRCLGPGRAVASLGQLVCSTCSALLGSQPPSQRAAGTKGTRSPTAAPSSLRRRCVEAPLFRAVTNRRSQPPLRHPGASHPREGWHGPVEPAAERGGGWRGAGRSS